MVVQYIQGRFGVIRCCHLKTESRFECQRYLSLQQWPLAKYLIPGCVGRESHWEQRVEPTAPRTWKSGNLEPHNKRTNKEIKIKIRSAQNVQKVWISRRERENTPDPFSILFRLVSTYRKHPTAADLFNNVLQFTQFGALAAVRPWGNKYSSHTLVVLTCGTERAVMSLLRDLTIEIWRPSRHIFDLMVSKGL